MGGVVIDGRQEEIPGIVVQNFIEKPELRLGPNGWRPRHTSWIRQIVLHSTRGIPGGKDQRKQVVLGGFGPNQDAAGRCLRAWAERPDPAGAHLVIDFDGTVSCLCDLETEAAQHGRHANGTSVGLEILQGPDAEFYLAQLETVVALVDWLTLRLKIQRQIPCGPYIGPIQRLAKAPDGLEDVVGVIGHRDFDGRRGAGDPGSRIFNMLGLAGYEPVDYELGADRDVWRRRQRDIGGVQADGIPGPATCAALARAERVPGLDGPRPAGLWVQRPVDALVAAAGDA